MTTRDPGPAVTVTVARSGGFGGLSRRWRVEAGGSDAASWIALVEQCPWELCSAQPGPGEPDRFSWTVHASLGGGGGGGGEQPPAEHEATGPPSAGHPSTGGEATDHPATEQPVAERPSADSRATEHPAVGQPPTERQATLTESEASGPWRTLIDAVRAASASSTASDR